VQVSEGIFDFYSLTNTKRLRQMNRSTAFILGEDVNCLEQDVCRELNVNYCVSAPGLEAGLYLALKAAGVQPADHVLCSGLASAQVIRAIFRAKATPMLVDINPNTFNIDPYCLEYVLGKCQRMRQPKPTVLIATDTFGLPCNYDAIESLCSKHGIVLIEDMSPAMGAEVNGKKAGAFGRFAVASLSPEAELYQEGEGAAVLCRQEEDMHRLRKYSRQSNLDGEDYVEMASKSSVRAGVARERMEEIFRKLKIRQKIARQYQELFAGVVKMQAIPQGYTSSFTRFVLLLPETVDRGTAALQLEKKEIPCSVLRPVLKEPQPGDSWDKVMLRNTQKAYERLLCIPIHAHLTDHIVVRIAQEVIGEIHLQV